MAPYPELAAKPNEHFIYAPPKTPFKHLTTEEARQFVTSGWIHVPNAINEDMISKWMDDLWVRSGYDANDKSTWKTEYLHLPFHWQVRFEKCAPEAYKKITDIIGGENNWDPERERWIGDNFIVNFGSETRSKEPIDKSPKEKKGWHYIPPRGGGTWPCEDGLTSVCKHLYDHPEGFDPALTAGDLAKVVYDCDIFPTAEGKKGDVLYCMDNCLTLQAIIISIIVASLPTSIQDKDYNLIEQTILHAIDRESIPEFKPTREKMFWYPHNCTFKEMRIPDEVAAPIKAAKAKGLEESAVDSIWLDENAIGDYNKRTNGKLLPVHEEAGFETVQHPI